VALAAGSARGARSTGGYSCYALAALMVSATQKMRPEAFNLNPLT